MPFCHLHLHNEYSLLDGVGKSEQYAKRASRLGFKYLGLTNHGNIDGLIKHQKACEKEGIVPIFGCELYVVSDAKIKRKGEKRRHMVAAVIDDAGWRNMCELLTYANQVGFYNRPRVDPETILKHSKGLAFSTACLASIINEQWGVDLVEALHDVYIEVMPHLYDEQAEHNQLCLQVAKRLGIPLIATNDCHYVKSGDYSLQEVMIAVNYHKTMSSQDRVIPWQGLHLRSEKEMVEAFKKQDVLSRRQYSKAMENTIEFAELCSGFRIKKLKMVLPELDEYGDPDKKLYKLAMDGLRSSGVRGRSYDIYKNRLDFEFNLIRRKGFSEYLIIVWDLLDFCNRRGIMKGPGRGSVGCSLLAYLIGITMIDPIKYRLPFHRFISEDRIDYPDIDMDFDATRIDEIKDYLMQTYGDASVFGVSTFNAMKGRQVIRDVARVFEVPLKEVDGYAKSIERSKEKGDFTSVKSWIRDDKLGMEFARKYPKIVDIASRLEGQIRSAGQHPAAVVIAPEDLSLRAVIVRRKDVSLANWDMDDLEHMGLVKWDILKLDTISVLQETIRLIKQNHDKYIDPRGIPLNDPKVYAEIAAGNVTGVFQVSGWATAKTAQEVVVENFKQLSDVLALSRPGPKDSGMTDEYIRRRHGERWDKSHTAFEKETKDTYGVVVYQEQVMGVLRSVGGFSYAEADRVRKIIGKKRNKKEFNPFKQSFVRGAIKKGTFTRKEAESFWIGLENHSRYSFNRAHSLEYAMVAYWQQWFKYYYPTEFISASLTYGSRKSRDDLIGEAKRLGLNIVPPKVGISDCRRWSAKGRNLYVPFIEIDGIGDGSLKEIEYLCSDDSGGGICGYFELKKDRRAKSANNTHVAKLLRKVGAFDDSVPDNISEYFNFEIGDGFDEGDHLLEDGAVSKRSYTTNELLYDCDLCELARECRAPVQPSTGLYNIAIVGEAPGRDEDSKGIGFVGRAGQLLWNAFSEYGLRRRMFHVTNVCKCYPKMTRTPTKEQISLCFNNWTKTELEDLGVKIALVFGNTGLYAFSGMSGGIKKLSGITQRIGGIDICWCIHPSAVLRNRDSNESAFISGIDNFVKTLKKYNFKV